MTAEPVDIRRAAERFRTLTDWLDSRHSFAFGRHHDPTNTQHGALLVNNEDAIAPHSGFDMHSHREMEILTWVLSGSLVHRDSEGHTGVIYPGLAQRMSAGTGIRHCEYSESEPTRFIQMWVSPTEAQASPSYEQRVLTSDLLTGELVLVASGSTGHAQAAMKVNHTGAALHVARLRADAGVELPDAPLVHVFIARGAAELEAAHPDGEGWLAAGDAARLTNAGARRLRATESAEVLVWEFRSGP